MGTGGTFFSSSDITTNGSISAAGDITAFASDRRLKKNLTSIHDWKHIITNLTGYRFYWTDQGCAIVGAQPDEVHVGLVAQEVRDVLPQAVAPAPGQFKEGISADHSDPFLTVKPEKLIPVLVEAVKSLVAQVDELTTHISSLSKGD